MMQASRFHPLLVFGGSLFIASAGVSCRKETKLNTAVDVREIRGERITPASSDRSKATESTNQNPVVASTLPTQPASSAVQSAEPAKSKGTTSSSSGEMDRTGDEPLHLGFDKLSAFTYEMPADLLDTNQVAASPASDKIPATVQAFDKKAVALKGFMLPLKVEAGLVTELLILRDQTMCCYGAVPKINEWVSVKMAGKGVKPIMDQPITLVGRLHVGEVRENGYLIGIYTMDGERIANPPGQ
jgi:hypothetical protein